MSRCGGSARRMVASVLISLAAAGGCAPAVRLTRETADGGVIRMPANTNQWPTYYRSRAAFLMQQKCPQGYLIDHEEAVGAPANAPDGRPAHDSYFGYTGGSDLDQIYHISFHAVTSGNRHTAAGSTPPAKKSAPPSTRPAEGIEELPPPRSLPPLSEKADKAP